MELVLSLCDRFHCRPSQLDEEDAEIIQMVAIQVMGTKQKVEEEPDA